MSYQVIARKWRPQAFDEVTGQPHVTTALRNAIRGDRVPHALLFTGPRGVGKTTLARLVARSLNCEKGPTDTPCGSCVWCEEISSGRSTDVQEIDAASRTSVDDVRELIEAVRYAPSPGKHRIFVVDEVHMLSTAAFNALLKTLEEPPPRSLFIFATTNPEKIPFTVISRCQRYDLRRIQTAEITARLKLIAGSEGIEISDAALLSIAREGDGSMRDAQTLLDQLIAYGGNQISDETVAEVLDLTDRRTLLAILSACIDRDAAAALEATGRALDSGTEPKRLAGELVQLLRDLVVLEVAKGRDGLVEGSDSELEELRELAARAEVARLRRMFRAFIKEQEDLAWAPQPAAVLEMAIVRIATLATGDDVGQLLSRLEALERKFGSGGGGGAGGSSGARSGSATGAGRAGGGEGQRGQRAAPAATDTRSASEASPRETPAKAASAPARTPMPPVEAARQPEAASPANAEGPETSAASLAEAADDAIPPAQDDADVSAAPSSPSTATLGAVEQLRLSARDAAPGLVALLEGADVRDVAGAQTIRLRHALQTRRLRERRDAFDDLCRGTLGHTLRIDTESAVEAGSAGATGGRGDPAERARQRQQRQAALEHPAVNIAIEELGAEIVEIRPLGR